MQGAEESQAVTSYTLTNNRVALLLRVRQVLVRHLLFRGGDRRVPGALHTRPCTPRVAPRSQAASLYQQHLLHPRAISAITLTNATTYMVRIKNGTAGKSTHITNRG